MRKVYGPVADQAKAANDNVIADHRAWIGPSGASMTGIIKGTGASATLSYTNYGHQPVSVERGLIFQKFSKVDWWGPASGYPLRQFVDLCMAYNTVHPTVVAFPSSPYQISYNSASFELPEPDRIVIDDRIISGDDIIAIIGCFVYVTFTEVHHTAFCFYYSATVTTNTGSLSICEAGNKTD
jgi:hypothetical protein